MSHRGLQTPNIGISLSQQAQILQVGGKVTRGAIQKINGGSNDAAADQTKKKVKKSNKRPDAKHRQLPYFVGEPDIVSWLSDAGLQFSLPLLANRKLQRLSKTHLPDECLFFQKNFTSGQYMIKQVKLLGKKTKSSIFLIEQETFNGAKQTRNISQDMGYLAAAQNFVFWVFDKEDPASMEQLRSIAKGVIHNEQIKRNERIRIRQSNGRQSKSTKQNDEMNQGEAVSMQDISIANDISQIQDLSYLQQGGGNEFSLPEYLIQPEQHASESNILREGNGNERSDPIIAEVNPSHQSLQLIEEEFADLPALEIIQITREPLNNFPFCSFPGLSYILLPAIILQPLNCSRTNLKNLIQMNFFLKKERVQMIGAADKSLISEILIEKVHTLVNQQKKQKLNRRQQQFFLYLPGISKCVISSIQSILPLSSFTHAQQSTLLSPFTPLYPSISNFLLSLNKYQSFQNAILKPEQSKLFFNRLCKFRQNKDSTAKLCIPYRLDNKKVLCRFFGDGDRMTLNWIQIDKILANYTLPKASDSQTQFFYLIDKFLSPTDGLGYLYSDYFYESHSISMVISQLFPQKCLSFSIAKKQRCLSCNFPMHNLPYHQCIFCQRFCHQECTTKKLRMLPDQNDYRQQRNHLMHPRAQEPREYIWTCDECEPCKECHLAVGKEYLKCSTCKHQFHEICGKLKVLTQTLNNERYTCQSCIKCKMCQNKLKNQEYKQDKGEFFCQKCYKDYLNNDYCSICVKQSFGTWIKCDRINCNKWVHLNCDPIVKSRDNVDSKPKGEVIGGKYWCPNCRKLQRRRLITLCIDELRSFDEFQYFSQPQYESLPDYADLIKNPMCLQKMKQKCLEGEYDQHPFISMHKDFVQIITNAHTYNMPKDHPHYYAKILNILGRMAFDYFSEIITCDQNLLAEGADLNQKWKLKRRQLYQNIYDNYLSILLNYGRENSQIIIKSPPYHLPEVFSFSSRTILNKICSDPDVSFKLRKKPQLIENLFTTPKIQPAFYLPIRPSLCPYHPNSNSPLIFSCQICCQSYCCTTVCFKHHFCTSCNVKGCMCDSWKCGCPDRRQKDKKNAMAKWISIGGLTKMEITQGFKYCSKCVGQNYKTNICYICKNFCCFGYEKCKMCFKIYHIECEDKIKQNEYQQFSDSFVPASSKQRLLQTCTACSYSPANLPLLNSILTRAIKSKTTMMAKITKYLPLIEFQYTRNGVRLSLGKIVDLLANNFDEMLKYEDYLLECYINFELFELSMQKNNLYKKFGQDCLINDLQSCRKTIKSYSNSQRFMNPEVDRQLRSYGVQKRNLSLYLKYFPARISIDSTLHNVLQLTNKIKRMSQGHQAIDFPLHGSQHSHKHEEYQINIKTLIRIEIEAMNQILYNSKKKSNQKKSVLRYIACAKMINQEERERRAGREPMNEQTRKQFENYLYYFTEYQTCIQNSYFQEENSGVLLSYPQFMPIYDFFSTSIYTKIGYTSLAPILQTNSLLYSSRKTDQINTILAGFLLKIFQEDKIVLRRGSTCVLKDGINEWRVLKKWGDNSSVLIKLEKKKDGWKLAVGDEEIDVSSVEEIIERIQRIAPAVTNFQELASFLGFTLCDSTYYEPLHFTDLLQKNPMDNLTRKKRKDLVQSTFGLYQWKKQGTSSKTVNQNGVQRKYEFNVTKKNIFYLKKRNKCQEESNVEVAPPPYITFEDIKRDLDETAPTNTKPEVFVVRDPTNDVYIAPSKIHKLGLFLKKRTNKNAIVIEYIGEMISQAVADLRQTRFHFGCYMFGLNRRNIDRNEIIDATFRGNMARYLNHSCDPNCKARIEMVNGSPRIFIYTIRDINQHEELTYDYQFKIQNSQKLICMCKAKNCQGRLN